MQMTAVVLLMIYLATGVTLWMAFCYDTHPRPAIVWWSFVLLTFGWPVLVIAALLEPKDSPWRRP